jgi:protease-4
MQSKSWEYMIWAGFLAICLIIGLAVGPWLLPKPVIGVVRFAAAIDLDTADQLISVLEEARRDDRVAAVVLELASPGGLATSSESIYYTMLKLRAEKPLVVVIDGMAVSGGYYMAAAANRIYAPASSYVGNVGTRGPRPDDPTLPAEEMSSGPFKLSGGSRFDRVLQIDRVKEAFVSNVVYQRQHAADNPLKIDAQTVAEARIYLGSEAVALGLVDYEGGRSDGIAGAADLAGLLRYDIVNLLDYLSAKDAPLQRDYREAVRAMVETAPPDAVFLLDSRIPLPGLHDSTDVERHLLRLREIAPASLDSVPDPARAGAFAAVATPTPTGEQP